MAYEVTLITGDGTGDIIVNGAFANNGRMDGFQTLILGGAGTVGQFGVITGDGMYQSTTLENFDGKMLDGGFVTWGSYIAHTEGMLAEQIKGEDTLRNQIACTALPDGVTMLTLQLCTAMKTCHVSRVIGLNLNIPNDIFNDFRRTYVQRENRITVDNKLTVASIYGGELTVLRPPYRQIGLTTSEWIYYDRGFLHTDIIAMPAIDRPSWFENK